MQYRKEIERKIKEVYASKQEEFENRRLSFRNIWTHGSDTRIFAEMCYCLCTPREKAKNALKAIDVLSERNHAVLINGTFSEIDKILADNGIALHPAKAERIIKNRSVFFPDTKNILRTNYCLDNIKEAREKLMYDVAGFGLKESSHFLRNIGFGENIAILDTHVKRQLISCGIIKEDEGKTKSHTITKNKYYTMENAMIKFSNEIKIAMWMLDMILMYLANDEIVK